jgi:ribonuclease P protein component
MLLSAGIDFNKVISTKPVSKDETFVVHITQNNKDKCRLGISVPKTKIKNATERNKLKRVIRHTLSDLELKPIDIVLVYRGTAKKYDAKLVSSSLGFHKDNIVNLTEHNWKTSE